MLGGFNALRAMNDALKQNRDNLRKKKKSPFSKERLKDMFSARLPEMALEDFETLSDEEKRELIQKAKKENKKELIRKLILLGVSIVIAVVLISAILLWKF